MNTKNSIFRFAILWTVIATVYSLSCYVCVYDVDHPNLGFGNIVNEECISEEFDGEKVKVKDGFTRCYTALAISNDEILSAHRGGGKAALDSFVSAVSRDQDDFILKYCTADYCNGRAPSMMTSIGLLISTFVIFCSTRNFFL